MSRLKIRLFLIFLIIAIGSFDLFSVGLLDRWYGQIIGDTFEVPSKLLSKVRHSPTELRAFIVVPLSAKDDPKKRFPVLYHLHGFGGDYQDAASIASRLRSSMRRYPDTELIHVFLDVSLGDGYHYFVNSEVTGPWESALINEFIPQFEKKFPAISSGSARFLTGHSSGGWSALWLQINHPDFFGGVWSVSPDPVDFSDFFGIDLSRESHDNFFVDSHGRKRKVGHYGKYSHVNMADYVAEQEEDQESPCDGDFGSYECAFSPKAADGQPEQLFDRTTGKINKVTALAWQKFNISAYLKEHSADLADRLSSRIHLFCGSKDDYFLERPFKKFCDDFQGSPMIKTCEIISGRGHGDMYIPTKSSPRGLAFRIQQEAHMVYLDSFTRSNQQIK